MGPRRRAANFELRSLPTSLGPQAGSMSWIYKLGPQRWVAELLLMGGAGPKVFGLGPFVRPFPWVPAGSFPSDLVGPFPRALVVLGPRWALPYRAEQGMACSDRGDDVRV